jgi:gas vesicle protein
VADNNLAELITAVKESLERELHSFERKLEEGFAQLNTRFDTPAARLDRHAALWQTGRRWSSRMDDWSEKIDSALEVKDREIPELRERIAKLEKQQSH